LHGGEALAARNAFAALSNQQQEHLITFLRSLHTPKDPGAGLRTENL
ncbi:MAG TPA: di-heme oxidoredictase family protein, partial [Planctomycetota bacterium]|nr:di-heme oxidoredictase family protein [Planctomycetota bacterium]